MQKFKLIAKTLSGLEKILASELNSIGATDITEHNRAVSFFADQALLYRANLCLRTALRVLKPIAVISVNSENELYDSVQQIDWSAFLNLDQTFAVDSFVFSKFFTHSKYVSLKVKDAIVDQFRGRTGRRPSVDRVDPDLRLNVHIVDTQCTISLDSSGDSLHKRGYRLDKNEAPLNEVLAAGLILSTGWNGQSHFVDPMCGSGTLLIEAALLA